MARETNIVSGFELVRQGRIPTHYLSYLIMKHDLTVLGPPKNFLLRRFFRSRYSPLSAEQLIKIITGDSLGLMAKFFLVSELKRIAGKIDLRRVPNSDPEEIMAKLADDASGETIELPAPARQQGNRTGTHPLKLVIEEFESDIKRSLNVFWLVGKVWFVKYAQEEWGLYPDQEKYRYIARLLSLSGTSGSYVAEYSIYNIQLYEKVSGKSISRKIEDDAEVMQDLTESDLSDKLSSEDLRGFRKVAYDLLEQLGDARQGGNQDRIKKAEDNIDEYRSYLLNEYGIKAVVSKDEKKISFHEFYRASKEIEKLRQVVKNQIGKAIKDFDRMPSFKSHLQHSLKVKSGKTFYSPEQPTAWSVSM